VRERDYLHDALARWHRWADKDVRTPEGNQVACWNLIDFLIENKVT